MKLKQCPSQTFPDGFLLELLQKKGGWGTAAGLKCTSQTLMAEADLKKWFNLSQVIRQWHPEEHQGTQWHRGQEQLDQASPANMGQDSALT